MNINSISTLPKPFSQTLDSFLYPPRRFIFHFFFLSLAIILVRLSPQQIVSFEFFFILKFLRMELFSIFGAKKHDNPWYKINS